MQSKIHTQTTRSFLPRDFVMQSEGFEIHLAAHYGMCFGVRDAIAMAEDAAKEGELTILGELVHNEVVRGNLQNLGVHEGALDAPRSMTREVLVTAHGASDRDKNRWREKGYQLRDSTCPLVHKAHQALATLVAEGAFPIVIGKADHVEVRGLMGDFPEARAVLTPEEITTIPERPKLGVVSQTTQPIARVLSLVRLIEQRFPDSEVIFRDTVCQPTKNRQKSLQTLAKAHDLVIVVGGRNSNNSRQLAGTARSLGAQAKLVTRASEVQADWLSGVRSVGVTAGTSTLKSCVEKVVLRLEELGGKRAQ